jgi:hypothetical protein
VHDAKRWDEGRASYRAAREKPGLLRLGILHLEAWRAQPARAHHHRAAIDQLLKARSAPEDIMLRFDDVREVRIEQQVRQVRVLIKRLFDVLEEPCTNRAAFTPHQVNRAIIQFPTELEGGHAHQLVALGLRANLVGVQCSAHLFDKLLLVPVNSRFGPAKMLSAEMLSSFNALIQCTDTTH